jgi:Ca2+/Na+ antiporter
MADEKKEEKKEDKKETKEVKEAPKENPVETEESLGGGSKKFFKILLGLIVIAAGVASYQLFGWKYLVILVKQVLGIVLVLIGLIIVALAWGD